jgi:hypothetical protein
MSSGRASRINGERRAAFHQVGPACRHGVEPLDRAVIDRQHPVPGGLFEEEGLHLLELFGVLRGEIICEAEVGARVVELPPVVGQPGARPLSTVGGAR